MNDNGNATHPGGAAAAAELDSDALTAQAALVASLAPAAPTAALTAPTVLAQPAIAPSSAVYSYFDLQQASAEAARQAKAQANRKAKAKAQKRAQARKAQAAKVSPKVSAAGFAGAVSFTLWTIAAATLFKNTFTAEMLAALVGSTTTIVADAAAYFRADPLRSGDLQN